MRAGVCNPIIVQISTDYEQSLCRAWSFSTPAFFRLTRDLSELTFSLSSLAISSAELFFARGSKVVFDFVNFYARRARRILPALILVVLATCLLGWFLLDAKEYFFVGATGVSSLLAISNFSFWRLQDYFATESQLRPLLMTWSLGIEEQFYLLFPAMIIATVRFAPGRLMTTLTIMTGSSLVVALWSAEAYPAVAFYLLPSRTWELGAGVMLVAWQIVRRGEPVRASSYGRLQDRTLPRVSVLCLSSLRSEDLAARARLLRFPSSYRSWGPLR